MIIWRRISPWCWTATICGRECRVWLSSDETRWCATFQDKPPGSRRMDWFADMKDARRTVAWVVQLSEKPSEKLPLDPLGVIRFAFERGSVSVQHTAPCHYGRSGLIPDCVCGASSAEAALRGTGP